MSDAAGPDPASAIAACLRRYLRLAPDAALDPRRSFIEHGFDSLMAVEFRDRLQHELGRSLPSTILFDHPNPDALAAWLDRPRGGAPNPSPQPLSPTDHDELDAAALRELVRRQAAQLEALEQRATEPIAIIGIGCRLPGGVDDAASLGALLDAGGDAIVPVPADRWDREAFFDPDEDAPGKIHTRHGGFLDRIDGFDASLFGISPREAQQLDPQQRLLLETTWHALEDAAIGTERWRGQQVGVFVGIRASEYFDSQCDRRPEDAESYYATGNALSTAAGRLSYTFGWTGPCFALDTACSSSLVAVHEAVQSLRQGQSSAAIAAGVNLLIDPLSSVSICKAHMLAADGRCKTFDARADGYGRAEGCGVVVLKRLSQALRDGDRVLATVRGSAINQDGRSAGLTVPHGPSQEAVIRAALLDGRLEPRDIDYVEAHGTGTELGDPIEIGALDGVFGERGAGSLLVGSVKTNLGHLECAAGIAGLIKTVVTLGRDHLPRHLHLETPNPHVDWQRTVVRVPTEPTPWPAVDRPRRAGVSSFGFSGTNAHVIVEQAPAPPAGIPLQGPQVLPLSAHTPEALQELAGRVAAALRAAGPDGDLAAICATAARGRAPLPYRCAAVADSPSAMAEALDQQRARPPESPAPAASPRVAFLFTGQGAQAPGMARELHERVPAFREALARAAEALAPHLDRPLERILWEEGEAIHETEFAQPALFATGYALAEAWRAMGVVPAVVAGHSVGEITAATVAGLCSLEDGARWIAARGRGMQATEPGAMAAVHGDPQVVAEVVLGEAGMAVAAHNGPELTVISGRADALQSAVEALASRGLTAQRLEVRRAFHSPLMDPCLDDLREVLETIRWRRPSVPLVSLLDPAARTAHLTEAGYWVRHAREPVAFVDGMRRVAEAADLLLECGPHPVLLGMARAFFDQPGIPSLRRGWADQMAMQRAAGALFSAGAAPDWNAWFGHGHTRAPLPGYPFERRRFWLQRSRPSAGDRAPVHPLLGRAVEAATLPADEHLFETELSASQPEWAADHAVFHRVVLPGAAFFELGLLGARHGGCGSMALRDVVIQAPLLLDDAPTTVQVHVRADGFAVHRRSADDDADEPWTPLASGRYGAPEDRPDRLDLPSLAADCGEPASVDAFYADLLDLGLAYGPGFRGITELRCGNGRALARIELRPEERNDPAIVHPALLDACFQATAAALRGSDRTWLPVGAELVVVHDAAPSTSVCSATLCDAQGSGEARSLAVDLRVADTEGQVWLEVRRLQLLPATPESLVADQRGRDLYSIGWVPSPDAAVQEPSVTQRDHWLIVGERDGLGLADVLQPSTICRAPVADLGNALRSDPIAHVVFAADDPSDPSATGLVEALGQTVLALAGTESHAPPKLSVVTRGAADADGAPTAPAAAALHGFVQSLALEHPGLRPHWIDLDPRPDPGEAERLVARIQTAATGDRLAFRHGDALRPRLQRARAARELDLPESAFRIGLSAYGSLDELELQAFEPVVPSPDHVRVRMLAAGLNFKDVLYALGMLEGIGVDAAAAERRLGFEGCGIVEAVGDGAAFAVGDRVLVSAAGCLATHTTVPAAAVMACPSALSAENAAAVQTVFLTALYGLERLAGLRAGQTVVIHAAAGGVGQAAIEVARRAGARILATASRPKHPALREQGIEHCFDSRDPGFAEEILAATNGRGADVVLNCLTGELASASARCLAEGGTFVEIGKIDVWSAERWATERPDAVVHRFDLEEVFAEDVALMHSLQQALVAGLSDGSLSPPPVTVYPAASARRAFAYLAQARQIGKVVVTMPRPEPTPDAALLITGGSGAVGTAFARELARRGHQHLVLASRRGTVDEALREELEDRGVRLDAIACDVAADAAAVQALVQRFRPVGIIHAAGVLDDALAASFDADAARAVMAPKVLGLENLLAAAASVEPAFVLAISSVTGWFGNPGQTVYGAANTAVDALCAAAEARGVPALAVAYGPWAGGGMAATVAGADGGALRERGLPPLEPAIAVRVALDAVRAQRRNVAHAAVRWSRFLAGSTQPPAFFDGFAQRTGTAAPKVAAEDWASIATTERPARITAILTQELAAVLGFGSPDDVPTERPFPELGIDSLMAVESRNRLEARLGLTLAATALFDHPTVTALAAHLAARLPGGDADPVDAEVDALAELSDAELERQLAAELERDAESNEGQA